MSQIVNYEFIERYQKLYEKDPRSKVFAPLGEAYRKMGLQKEALQVLKRGVRFHPHFASGRVALAKVYMDSKDFPNALTELLAATELSPENLLAQKLLAECYIFLKKTREALKAYKMVLFLNPNDAQAHSHIKKLESLTADEYDEEVFEMRPLRAEIAPERFAQSSNNPIQEPNKNAVFSATHKERQLERVISLADAFIARLDLQRALETLNDGEKTVGKHPEIAKRKSFISSRLDETIVGDIPLENSDLKESHNTTHSPEQRIDFLKDLLQKIESRRRI